MSLNWQRFLIAVDEQGEMIGCGQIKPHGDGSRELASIAVMPERQGQGIGKTIIEALLEDASLPIYLTCRDSIETYYHQFGFQAVAYDQMPPYFKRIYQISMLLRKLVPDLSKLRVMIKKA